MIPGKVVYGLYQGLVICRTIVKDQGLAILHQLPPLPVAVELGGEILK
jgi:hypothetical protein